MSADCCNGTLTVLQSVLPASCDAACGITCTSIGLLQNKSCAFCSGKLVRDNNCIYPRFDPSTIVTPVKPTNNYCQGRACNMCNDGDLQSVPEGAVIHITSACSMDANVPGKNVTIHNSQASTIASMTLVLYVNVILSGFPLTTSNLNIISPTSASMYINMSGPAVDNDLCAFTVTGQLHNNHVNAQLLVDIIMLSNQECLLGIFSNKRQTNLIANNVIAVQSVKPANTKFYAAAVANVQGQIEVPDIYTVLYMETDNGKFNVIKGKEISVSNLLSIFGTLYEIEYFDPDGRSSIEPRMPWLTHANKILTLVAAIAGGALLNT